MSMPIKMTDVYCSIDIHFHPALISRLLMLRRIRSFSAKSRLVTVTLQSARQVCAGRIVLSTALLPTPVGDDVPGAGRGQ